ncbi:hypothetical protein [Paraburkholderia ferrariae]|uniref:hypothetical protein n=1 Tax=Paraburkholderia ferrariae TaxID=386056 RepID=UPI0004866CC8|nr:hypothetical protein [Paraburkholderia ferrariae]
MENYYVIEPEVAGGFGERTIINRSSGKMVVTRLHYELEGWLGDPLLESTPCYIATKDLAREIENRQLSGVEFDFVEITLSDQFEKIHANKAVPDFVWLKAVGEPGKDDFGIGSGLRLVVSERVLDILKQYGVSHAASITSY